MIVQSLYAIRDIKAEHFLPPFISFNDNTAVRHLADAVNSEGHDFARNPADFSLHKLGIYDSATGQIEPNTPQLVAEATSLIRSEN